VASVQEKFRFVNVLRKGTRLNFPRASASKRGESSFVLAFGRIYLKQFEDTVRTSFFPAREFQVAGFGVADFVWFAWKPSPKSQEGSAVEFHPHHQKFNRESLFAFEMKLRDWRKALGQAYRYRYFADAAYVVLPPQAAKLAKQHLDLFKKLRVGLWAFDKHAGKIRKFYSPRRGAPLSSKARERAVVTLARFVKARPVPGKV
jgi:hypothetical protein